MAKMFLTAVDLNGNELQNGVLQNLASAPGTPSAGRIYYDTVLNKIGYYNGSAWIYAAVSSVSGTLPITASNTNGAITIAINAATGSTAGSMSATDKTKLDAATASNVVSTLVLRDGSGNFAANLITMNQGTVTNAPVNPTDIVNKAYADGLAQGLDVKESVRVATIGDITLSGTQTIDDIAVIAGDRVLVKAQIDGEDNGIYIVAAGAWSRATDADTSAEVSPGLFTFVEEGTVNADTGWVLSTNGPITLGTTPLVFVKFSSAGTILAGAGLTKTGDTIDVVNGGGLIVNANDVAVDFASTVETDAKSVTNKAVTPAGLVNHPRRYSVTGISIGTTPGVQTITHNLGTRAVVVSVIDSTTYEEYEVDVVHATTNTITIDATGSTKTVIVTVIG